MDLGVGGTALAGHLIDGAAGSATSALERMKHRLDLFELAVKATVAVELAVLWSVRPVLPPALRQSLSDGLERPSLGTWVRYHRECDTALRQVTAWPRENLICQLDERHQLVAMRNQFVHSPAVDLLHDAAVAALDTSLATLATSGLLAETAVRTGASVGPGLRRCLVRVSGHAEVDAAPLLYARSDPGSEELLLYQSWRRKPAGRRAAYGGPRGVRLHPEAADREFAASFPLRRWARPAVESLGHPVPVPAAVVGRDSDRARLAGFLRAGAGTAVVHGPAGMGKSTLLACVLDDVRGLRRDSPEMPAVTDEPVAVGYFVRRGTPSAEPTAYLSDLVSAVGSAYGLPPLPDAGSDLDRFTQLKRVLATIDSDLDRPPLALVLDGLDESERLRPFIPAGTDRVRVLVGLRPGARTGEFDWERSVRLDLRLDDLAPEFRSQLGPADGPDGSGNPLFLRFAANARRRGLEVPPVREVAPLVDALLVSAAERAPVVGRVLRGLAEFDEPLGLEALATVADCDQAEIRRAIAGLASPFVTVAGGDADTWTFVHDLVRERLMEGAVGSDTRERIRSLSLREAGYDTAAAPHLVRRGAARLCREGTEPGRLAGLLSSPQHLRLRLAHQPARRLLADLDTVAGGLGEDSLPGFVASVAEFVATASADPDAPIRPEHLQDAFLGGELGILCRPLLDRLSDESVLRSAVSDPGRAAALLMAFRYGRANMLRRTCEKRQVEEARTILRDTARLVAAERDAGDDRELARLHYDLGYIAHLRGESAEAVAEFRTSGEHAARGGDEVGRWIARCLELRMLVDARQISAWLAEAGLHRAVAAFGEVGFAVPHAARWVHNARRQGFDLAVRFRAADRADVWLRALADDARAGRASPLRGPDTVPAHCRMLAGDWAGALEVLRPIADARLADGDGELPRVEEVARLFVKLGVVLWHLGARGDAESAWQLARTSSDSAANRPWQRQADRLVADPGPAPWLW